MVKVFFHLGWLVAFLVTVSIARPVHPRVYPSQQYQLILPAGDRSLQGGTTAPPADQALADDGAVRSERSTNLSHITGTARMIQMYIKNRYLQVLPDGTVNGTSDDGSVYTILQRQSVNTGQLLVQSVATCLFMCMDSCGLLYGSRNFTGDCVFNETIEQHTYNTYSSSKYSNDKRTLYVALNKRGEPRKVQVPRKASLGKLSSYAMVLTSTVAEKRIEDLAERILRVRESLQKESKLTNEYLSSIVLAQHPLRHHGHHHMCPQVQWNRLQQNGEQENGTDGTGRDKFRCRRRKKRKKKKRRCREGELEGELCQNMRVKRRKKCQEGEGEEECQKRLEAAKRRRKSRNGDKKFIGGRNENFRKDKKKQKSGKMKKRLSDGEIAKDVFSDNSRTVVVSENQTEVNEHVFPTTTVSTLLDSRIPSSSPSTTVTPVSTTSTTNSSASVTSSLSTTSTTALNFASLYTSTTGITSTVALRSSVATDEEDEISPSSSGTSTTIGTAK